MAWAFFAGYLAKLAIVAIALAVLYLLARWLRRTRFFARDGRFISVVETAALTPHAALYVVRAGSRYLLLGTGVCVLAEIAGHDDEPDGVTDR